MMYRRVRGSNSRHQAHPWAMSTNPDLTEAEAITSPDGDTLQPAEPDTPPSARPHEPGAQPTPLSRLLYP